MKQGSVAGRGQPAADRFLLATVELSAQRAIFLHHPVPSNGRITLVTLTDAGYAKVVASAPAHVKTVRRLVIDSVTKQQFHQLGRASETILTELTAPSERPPHQGPTRE